MSVSFTNVVIPVINKCWVCGTSENITNHHAIPKRLKPIQNIFVPVCKPCHGKINLQDQHVHNIKIAINILKRIELGSVGVNDG